MFKEQEREHYQSNQQTSNSSSDFEKMTDDKKLVEALRAFGFEDENFTKSELTKSTGNCLRNFTRMQIQALIQQKPPGQSRKSMNF